MIHQSVEVNTGKGQQARCFACYTLLLLILFLFVMVIAVGAYVVCNEVVSGYPSGKPVLAMCRGSNA